MFRTNFGCPEEDGSLAASRSVSRCCSKGFAVSSIRDSGTAKTVHANVTGQWMFQKSSAPNQGQSAALVSWSSAPYPPTRCRWPVPARHLLPFLPLGRAGASTQFANDVDMAPRFWELIAQFPACGYWFSPCVGSRRPALRLAFPTYRLLPSP